MILFVNWKQKKKNDIKKKNPKWTINNLLLDYKRDISLQKSVNNIYNKLRNQNK